MRVLSICDHCHYKRIIDYTMACAWPPKKFQGFPVESIVCFDEQEQAFSVSDATRGRCPQCDSPAIKHKFQNNLKFRYNPAVKCTGKCRTATSTICSCECGGKNHGIALKPMVLV